MIPVRLLPETEDDLRQIVTTLNAQSAGLGRRFADNVDDFGKRIGQAPRMYARVPRGVRGREFREGMLLAFPYRVVYEIGPSELVVIAITHAHRHRQPWRNRV